MTRVASFGSNELAYPVKRAGETFHEGEFWTIDFHASPTFVKDLRKDLSNDHRIIRQLVTKEPRWPPLYYFSSQALQRVADAQNTPEMFSDEGDSADKGDSKESRNH